MLRVIKLENGNINSQELMNSSSNFTKLMSPFLV